MKDLVRSKNFSRNGLGAETTMVYPTYLEKAKHFVLCSFAQLQVFARNLKC